MRDRSMSGNGKSRIGSDCKDKGAPCKMVLLGSSGVGKTALTVRYLTKRFIGEYCPTLESIYKYHTIVDDEDVRWEILDTAGHIDNCTLEGYSLWADCFVFVYSITDRQSFSAIKHIAKQVEIFKKSASVSGILVGNKSDLLHDRQVAATDGSSLAETLDCKFFEVSASDWTQVICIQDMVHSLYRDYKKSKSSRESRHRKASSSTRFKQAIQKVISGRTPSRRSPTM